MKKVEKHKWTFRLRFRRNAFGWKSGPPIQRIKEAVSEIKKVARKDPSLGAEGAVQFLERVAPALAHVDSSSGAIGNAVNRAIEQLVPVVATALSGDSTQTAWLDRLFAALKADRMPYIERLGGLWGDLCVSPEIASAQADKLLSRSRKALDPKNDSRDFFSGTMACLGALYKAERHAELIELTGADRFWPYRKWSILALAAQGKRAEAIRQAEACRDPWTPDLEVDRICEEILLSSGMAEEAYRRYGLAANPAGTYLATFRLVAKKYPHQAPETILADLVASTPGEEGKWFAAAKSIGLFAEALDLAKRSPVDPKTLTRAARDFAAKEPDFATGAGLLALHWLLQGHGYEITGADVWAAYEVTLRAAEQQGTQEEIKRHIRGMVAAEPAGDRFVSRVLGKELGLS